MCLRWASQESARQLDEFRYRVIGGREFVSFRMVPRYSIDIGTREIIVVACARGSASRRFALALRRVCRRLGRGAAAALAWLVAPRAPSLDATPVRKRRAAPFAAARRVTFAALATLWSVFHKRLGN